MLPSGGRHRRLRAVLGWEVTIVGQAVFKPDPDVRESGYRIGCIGAGMIMAKCHLAAYKQAGFQVLKSHEIPSVLVEAAFLSNKRENKLLRDSKWQKEFARLLAEGIHAYCRSMEESQGSASTR